MTSYTLQGTRYSYKERAEWTHSRHFELRAMVSNIGRRINVPIVARGVTLKVGRVEVHPPRASAVAVVEEVLLLGAFN